MGTDRPAARRGKVGVVGVGAVGAATTLALIERGVCRELVLIDRDAARARAVALDMGYGAPLSPAVSVEVGGYDDLAGAHLVIITAGVNEKAGGPPTGRTRRAGFASSTPTPRSTGRSCRRSWLRPPRWC